MREEGEKSLVFERFCIKKRYFREWRMVKVELTETEKRENLKCLEKGEPLNYVKEQLGHASIQTKVDVYGQIVPESNRNSVNRLDDNVLSD